MENNETLEVSATADTSILNEESYNRLKDMLGSSDPENHKMAQLILNQLNIRESIYYIWLLSKNHSSRMVYLRTKAGREFQAACQLFGIAMMDEQQFAVWLRTRHWLNIDLYQKLKRGIRNRIGRDNTNPFYDFHITIKPEFLALDPSDQITKL
jgi:hypothetical protein